MEQPWVLRWQSLLPTFLIMGTVESQILHRSVLKPLVWKRFIDDILAEISDTDTTFLDTSIYKGERFANESILDIETHFKPTETLQYTHFSSCHPPGVKRGFIKGEALRLLRTNSSETTFKTAVSNFKTHLKERGFPETLISTTLAEIRFEDRKLALQQRRKQNLRILPFVTQYRPSVPNLKQILMQKWHLIQQQPLLNKMFKDPPMVAYKRGRPLKDTHSSQTVNWLLHVDRSCVGLSPYCYLVFKEIICLFSLFLALLMMLLTCSMFAQVNVRSFCGDQYPIDRFCAAYG